MSAVVLLVLSACNVFKDGTIEVTCDDLPACSGADTTPVDSGDTTDTGDAPPVELGLGVTYAATDVDTWTVAAHEAPDLDVAFQRSGLGDFGGPSDYNPLTGRALVATAERLYVFGPEDDAIASHLMPTTAAPVDIVRTSFGAIVMTPTDLVYQEAPAEVPELIKAAGTVAGNWMFAFTDADRSTAFFVAASTTGEATLYAYLPSEGMTVRAKGFAADARAQLGGGGFIGPDGTISFCTVDGGVFALEDLEAGGATAMVQFAATSDVIRCAWDSTAGLYLGLQDDGALLIADPDSGDSSTRAALLRDGLVATSATFFED